MMCDAQRPLVACCRTTALNAAALVLQLFQQEYTLLSFELCTDLDISRPSLAGITCYMTCYNML
jgi:hypothetical protein